MAVQGGVIAAPSNTCLSALPSHLPSTLTGATGLRSRAGLGLFMAEWLEPRKSGSRP